MSKSTDMLQAVRVGDVMSEWPLERRARQNQSARHSPFMYYIPDGAKIDENTRPEFFAVVEEVLAAARARLEPKATLTRLERLALLVSSSENGEPSTISSDLILVLACIEALKRQPTAGIWDFLWSLAWNSSVLEHGLPKAVIAAAASDALFKSQFLIIAATVIENIVREPQRRARLQERARAKQLGEDWEKKPELIKLWWGIDNHSLRFLPDDDGIFRIVADLDLNVFIDLLVILRNPYGICAALFISGASSVFIRWQALVRMAPKAFHDDGTWNGSPILPILLVICLDQLQHARVALGPVSDLTQVTNEISDLTTEIAKTIASRVDAASCALRWATWLMRQTLASISNQPKPFPENARSPGYAESIMIDALINETPTRGWQDMTAADAEPWEAWCRRCVLALAAVHAKTPMPPIEAVLSEWNLTAEDWASKSGHALRMRAQLFEIFGKRPDAYGFRLLALPLTEVSDPCAVWNRLWHATTPLREIVEFGDADAKENEEWRGRSEAGGLIRIAFGLGLMMMDHIFVPSRELGYDRRVALQGLLRSLAGVVREMSAIDHFDQGYWTGAMRHLAIRRATWLAENLSDQPTAAAVAFDESTTPCLADFMSELAGNPEGLLGFIEVALRNHVGHEPICSALTTAGINLRAEIELAELLIKLSPKRTGIGPEQISVARTLLDA